MTAARIDGKGLAQTIRSALADEVSELVASGARKPGLAVVLVGDDPASTVYVRMKERAAAEVGIFSEKHHLPVSTSSTDLIRLIRRLNRRDDIHGILVQLPLPAHIDEQLILHEIDPAKDIDGFHPVNAGQLLLGGGGFRPCTPAGIIELIKSTGEEIAGKEAVVVGRSNIVGKPAALMLLRENATVTICHSKTDDLAGVCRRADILIAAVGKAGVIGRDHIKPGAIVIDVGVNRLADGGLVGDVDFHAAQEVAGYITPVPGGVGPMTIAMLLKNTLLAAKGLA